MHRSPPLYDTRHYSSDWLSQSTSLALQKSLAPRKLLIESEWHLFSAGTWPRRRWDDEAITHCRVWLAVLSGQGGAATWYWGRNGRALSATPLGCQRTHASAHGRPGQPKRARPLRLCLPRRC